MITPQAANTSQALVDALHDARRVELGLLDSLTDAQLLGVRGHFLEPPIWEMGHVGWFQEYWLLRRLDAAAPLLHGADDIYDSFNVSYTRRWDHRFPSRADTLAYITAVLERSVARLESREPRDADEAYLYTLAAQHEDMH
jgi:iron(II)-dependent oxidoreductase